MTEKEQTMNLHEIQALESGRHNNPHHLLGPHVLEKGLRINAYLPTAAGMSVVGKKNKKLYEMSKVDENGFFSVDIEGMNEISYRLMAVFEDGNEYVFDDPYAYEPVLTREDIDQFQSGEHDKIYDKLGAHRKKINGVWGVLFAVWAPQAERCSVVGNFNLWDGRRNPMRKLEKSGIYELFIPGLEVGELYKYEIRSMQGAVFMKADPYANAAQLRPDNASMVTDITGYKWTDQEWMKSRKKVDTTKLPMAIYEVHIGGWKKPDDEREFYNYREIAVELAAYVKEMGYTHIEVMPITEYPFDASWGYQVTGYYAPTARYGTPKDFMYFMDYMHEQGIGVILDWVPAHFPKDGFGLGRFDGTAVYEDPDPRKGEHPDWGTYIFNLGRYEVVNFLMGSALFWLDKYHVDGIRMDAVASMLYLDYGRKDGQWVPNQYGDNKNLESISFLKKLNDKIQNRKDGSLVIAEESTAFPYITRPVKEEGLGFDYKWNMGWMNDFLDYMKTDPLFRKGKHGELTFSMVYAYSENYILVLSHDEVVHGKCSMLGKMPGEWKQKFDHLRVAYGFMMMHPGKKLLFMGQEFAQVKEFDEKRSLDWELLEHQPHKEMQNYVKALNHLYQTEPALYALDTKPEGFEWINQISADESIVAFVRKSRKKDELLLVVCNFTPVERKDYKIGVPYKGKYKEFFNSDAKKFGGTGSCNPRMKQSRKEECDNLPNSIRITVPPLSTVVFRYHTTEK